MNSTQYEKYIEAAKDVLRHLRVYPLTKELSSRSTPSRASGSGFVWNSLPREPVDDPRHAIKETTDEIIAWYVAQQQKWGELHREALTENFGGAHAVYLEAAWRVRYAKPRLDVSLAQVALKKWSAILTDAGPQSPFIDWAKAWRALPAELTDQQIRAECLAITSGRRGGVTEVNHEDFAPPYEISFHEAQRRSARGCDKAWTLAVPHRHWQRPGIVSGGH